MNATIKLTLDEKLKKENMSRYRLAKETKVMYQTIDAYYKNKVKRYDSHILLKICVTLNCGIEEIITIERTNTK